MTGLLDRIAAIASSDGLPLRPRVLLALLCYANDNGDAWPAVPTLAKALGASDRKVREALKSLEDDGLIVCEERGKGGRNRGTTHWRVAPDASDGALLAFRNPAENGQGLDAEKGAQNGQGLPSPTSEKGARNGQGIDDKPCPKRAETLPKTGPKPCPKRAADYTIEDTMNTMEAPVRPMVSRPVSGIPRLGDLTVALDRVGLRITGNPFKFGARLSSAADAGLTREDLGRLVRKAAQDGENPMGLLWHWLEDPSRWRDVVLDVDQSGKLKLAKSREGGGLSSAKDLIRQVLP